MKTLRKILLLAAGFTIFYSINSFPVMAQDYLYGRVIRIGAISQDEVINVDFEDTNGQEHYCYTYYNEGLLPMLIAAFQAQAVSTFGFPENNNQHLIEFSIHRNLAVTNADVRDVSARLIDPVNNINKKLADIYRWVILIYRSLI